MTPSTGTATRPGQGRESGSLATCHAGGQAARSVGSLGFRDEGVEKPVVIVLCVALDWQELSLARAQARGRIEVHARRVAVPREESVDLIGVLDAKHRACRVEQSAAGRDQRPQCFEEPSLL